MLPKTNQSRRQSNLNRFALALVKHLEKKRQEQGFSLIESLVAIVLITIIISAISPPLFLAAATRVQNRRAEQAMHLAQGEVDRIRRLMENPPPSATADEFKKMLPQQTVGGTSQVDKDSDGGDVNWNDYDLDGNGTSDFGVQTFRNEGVAIGGKPVAFQMGVRVYSIVAKGNTLEKEAASLKFTTALGQQKRRPLAVIYTTVVRSDTKDSLCAYRKYLGDTPSWCPPM